MKKAETTRLPDKSLELKVADLERRLLTATRRNAALYAALYGLTSRLQALTWHTDKHAATETYPYMRERNVHRTWLTQAMFEGLMRAVEEADAWLNADPLPQASEPARPQWSTQALQPLATVIDTFRRATARKDRR